MDRLIAQRIWTDDSLWHFEFRNPQIPYPLHSHNFYEIVFIYSGSGTHVTQTGKDTRLKAGDVIFVKPGQVHGYKDIDNMILMNILIRPSFFESNEQTLSRLPSAEKFFRDKGLSENSRPIVFSLNKMQLFEVRAIIEEMQEELSSQHVCWELAGEIYLFQLLIMLLRIYNDPNYPNNAERNGAEKLIKYIEKNYAKKITMQDLIDNGNMSESTILRNFKRITGYPPFEYQMRQRMFASIQKLIYTDYDITQIAYAVGFNDSNYFSRCFKKFINMTPREYRMKYKSERAFPPPEQDGGNTAGDEI